jgi:hypothetical protein
MLGYGHRTIAGLTSMITCHVTIFSIGAYLQLFRLYFSPPLFLRFGHSFRWRRTCVVPQFPKLKTWVTSGRPTWVFWLWASSLAATFNPWLGDVTVYTYVVLLDTETECPVSSDCRSADCCARRIRGSCWKQSVHVHHCATESFQNKSKNNGNCTENHTCLPCHTISVQNLV